MISLLIQTGADIAAFNTYHHTPVDFGPKVLVKELGLEEISTNINLNIRNKIMKDAFSENKFVIFDELSSKVG